MKAIRRQSGFTLIEVMIAMAVISILFSAVFAAFFKSNETFRYTMALADIQERGRFAISFLKEAIETANYRGCRQDASVNNQLGQLGMPASYNWNFDVGIQGFDTSADDGGAVLFNAGQVVGGVWAPALAAGVFTSPIKTGDAITVRGSVGTPIQLTANMPNSGASINIAPASDTFGATPLFMMVSSCRGGGEADVFQQTDATPGNGVIGHAGVPAAGAYPGNQFATLKVAYTTSSQVVQVQSSSFYIRQNANGENSLYVRRDGNAVDELIEGVDGMQILYGVDTNLTDNANVRSANQYLTATQVNNGVSGVTWANVMSVRIALLVRSMKAASKKPNINRTYNLLGVTYGPYPATDWNSRRVFVTTVSLRNRMR